MRTNLHPIQQISNGRVLEVLILLISLVKLYRKLEVCNVASINTTIKKIALLETKFVHG
jgi:hypothetical protein